MKATISILLFIFSFVSLFGQTPTPISKSFPTNVFEGNSKELKKFDEKIVAFDGVIEKIESSRNNTPFYKLKISGNNYLWTVLMFSNETNKIGDKVRVVGYLSKSNPIDSEKLYLDTKYMVIAFGLVDFKNSNFLFVRDASNQKKEWLDGKIPTSK